MIYSPPLRLSPQLLICSVHLNLHQFSKPLPSNSNQNRSLIYSEILAQLQPQSKLSQSNHNRKENFKIFNINEENEEGLVFYFFF